MTDGVGPYGAAALDLLAAGWRGVIPLPYGHKYPPVSGFTGEAGIFPSRADVQAWLDGDEATHNVALRLGYGELGIDVDAYAPKNGAETLAKCEALWGALPPTWRSTSRDDGVSGIYLFRIREGLRWPGELGPDVELVKYSHRYAVTAPSIHPNGAQYRWISPNGESSDTPPSPDDLPYLPDAWVAGITGGELDESTDRADLSTPEISSWLTTHGGDPSAAPCHRVDAALTQGRADLGTGSRHDAGCATTLYLTRLIAEGHPGGLGAIDTFRTAFLAACYDPVRGARKPGEAEREFASMLRSAVNVVTATPTIEGDSDPCDLRSLLAGPPSGPVSSPAPADSDASTASTGTTATPTPDATPDPATIEAAVERETVRLRIRERARDVVQGERAAERLSTLPDPATLTELQTRPRDRVRWRVDGLLPAEGNATLTAVRKTGKTTMIGNLVASLADGKAFLDRFIVRPVAGTVFILNYEVSEATATEWLRPLDIVHTDRVVMLTVRGRGVPLLSDAGAEWLITMLRTHDAEVGIIDPAGRAFTSAGGLNENDNSEVLRFTGRLDEIKTEAGVGELVLPIHGNRGATEGAERSRGASAWADWPDALWQLTTDENHLRYLSAFGRDVDVSETKLSFDSATRRLIVTGGSRRVERLRLVLDDIIELVGGHPGWTGRAIEQRIVADGGGRNAARDALQYLVERGQVRADAGPNRSHLHYLTTTCDEEGEA